MHTHTHTNIPVLLHWHVIRRTSLIGTYFLLSTFHCCSISALLSTCTFNRLFGHMKATVNIGIFRQCIAQGMSSGQQMMMGMISLPSQDQLLLVLKPSKYMYATLDSCHRANRSTCKVFVIRCILRIHVSAYFLHVEM